MAEFGSSLSDEERERLLYWKNRFERAKDEHEVTRVVVEHRIDGQSQWLEQRLTDLDKRIAAEMREHARKTQAMILGLLCLVVLLYWLR